MFAFIIETKSCTWVSSGGDIEYLKLRSQVDIFFYIYFIISHQILKLFKEIRL